jgi:hypothetical protein
MLCSVTINLTCVSMWSARRPPQWRMSAGTSVVYMMPESINFHYDDRLFVFIRFPQALCCSRLALPLASFELRDFCHQYDTVHLQRVDASSNWRYCICNVFR